MKRKLILIHHLILALIKIPSKILTTTTTTSSPTLTSRRNHVSSTSVDTVRYTYLPAFTVCRVYPKDIAAEIEQPNFPDLIGQFIYNQGHSEVISYARNSESPKFYGRISIYPSAQVTFRDTSGSHGMRRQRIHAVKSWRNGPGRYDTVFVKAESSVDGLCLDVARVKLFFFIFSFPL